MGMFNLNPRLDLAHITSDVFNCLLLRDDIHRVFDDAMLVFSPKNGKYVSHFLNFTTNLGHLYHNCETWELGVRAEFLYARFAWAVLQLHSTFVALHKPTSDQSPPNGDGNPDSEDGNGGRGRGRGGRGGRGRGRKGPGGRNRALGKGSQRSSERLKLKGKEKPNPTNLSKVEAWKRYYPGLGLYPQMIFPAAIAELFFFVGSEVSNTMDPAWNSATWYPGVEIYGEMRERALAEREPELHKKECARVEKLLSEGGVLWGDDDS